MRTAKDFAWFKTKLQYDNKIGTADVDQETICFISDDHTIYTHNTQFGGNNGLSTTYEGSSSININNNVISVNQDWVDSRINNAIGGISGGSDGKTYQSGDNYINVDNVANKIFLNISTLEAKLENDGFKESGSGGGINNVNNYYYTGITADFDSDSLVVVKNQDGTNPAIQTSPKLSVYFPEDGRQITGNNIQDIEVISITDGNGRQYIVNGNIDEHISVSRNGQIVTINVSEGAFNMNQCGGTFTFTFKVTALVTGVNIYGIATYTIYSLDAGGEFVGKNGISWKIVVPGAVTADANNNNLISPNQIEPYIEIYTSVGVNVDDISENTSVIRPSDLSDSDYKLCYRFDNGQWADIAQDGEDFFVTNLSGQPLVQKTIYVALVKIDDPNKPFVGLQQIPVVLTGRNGLNATGIDYQIQPVMSTVAKKYDNNDDPYIEGSVKVKLFKSTNGVREELSGNLSDNYAMSLQCFVGSQFGDDFTFDANSSTYNLRLDMDMVQEDQTYLEIILKDTVLDTRLASIVIPVRIDGKDGEPGTNGTTTVVHEYEIQNLDFPVMRLRNEWLTQEQLQNAGQPLYNNGTVVEDGVYYTDVVVFYGCYFRCTVAGTTNQPCVTDNNGVVYNNGNLQVNSGWAAFSYTPAIITEYLIANQAFIQSLASKQIVIEDNNNNIVAGMASGRYIASQDSGLTDTSTNGVRIWAGPLGSGGNVAAAPFTVDELGKLRATNAELYGSLYTGNRYTGLISETYPDISGNVYGLLAIKSSTLVNAGTDQAHTEDRYVFFVGGHPNRPADLNSSINRISPTGAGKFANGNLTWDDEGNVTAASISFTDNIPTIVNNGQVVDTTSKYSLTPTIVAEQGDTITLPNNVPDGTVLNILVRTTNMAPLGNFENNTNSVKVICGSDGAKMSEYYSGEWHTHAERDTWCERVGMYFFVKKGDYWYAMFPY